MVDGKQKATFRRYEDTRDHVASIKGQIRGLIQDNLVQRLETNQLDILKSSAVVLNSKAWDKENTCFADDELQIIASQFSTEDLLEEWHEMLEYAVTYLDLDGVPYSKIWYKLFNPSRKKHWENILILAELPFCFPVSNAAIAISFSPMKRFKSPKRCSLSQARLC